MPMKVSKKAWTRWQSVIQKLWKDFEFPANTRDSLSGYFSLFRGEGSCFRLDTESWKMVLDVLRTGDDIIDIVAITLASNLAPESIVRGGWAITTRCPIHPHPKHPSHKSPAKDSSDKSDLLWYKIEEGGRVSTHCCNQECVGPFKPNSWKVFDAVRQGIVIKTLEHEVLQLRFTDKPSELEEKKTRDSELKAQIASITREKMEIQGEAASITREMMELQGQIASTTREKIELQAQIASITREKMELQTEYDTMNGLHTEQAHDLIEIQAENRDLVTYLAKVDAELSETKAKLAASTQTSNGEIQKRRDASEQLATTLNLRLHEALEEIQNLKRGSGFRRGNVANTGISLQQQAAAHEAATSIASKVTQWSPGNAMRSQSLSIRSRPRIEVVDLTCEAGPADSPSKGLGYRQEGIESEREVADQPSSSRKDGRKRKRDAKSVAPNDEDEDDTPSKRRSSKGRRHGPKIKAEPEA